MISLFCSLYLAKIVLELMGPLIKKFIGVDFFYFVEVIRTSMIFTVHGNLSITDEVITNCKFLFVICNSN